MTAVNNIMQKGFVALVTVLLVLAITLIVGLSISLLSISEAKMGLQKKQSSRAYYLANLCAEQALMNLKENPGYAGGESIVMSDGSCDILQIEGNWTVKVAASSTSNHVKKMRVIVSQINPQMVIDSWEEVASF